MRNKMLWTLPMIALAIMLGTAVKTYAGTNASGRGWLWGSTNSNGSAESSDSSYLGWVSMNCLDNPVTGKTCGPGAASATNLTDYGVKIPTGNDNVTGHAWSRGATEDGGYGWISFNESDLANCPGGPCNARRDGDVLKGWARILSIKKDKESGNSGGWSGWISLNSDNCSAGPFCGGSLGKSYGVAIDNSTAKLSGYAWSDELGWIDFSKASVVVPKILKIQPQSQNIKQGESYTFKACYSVSGACGGIADEVTAAWTSSKPSELPVTAGKVTAFQTGNISNIKATITAKYMPSGGTELVATASATALGITPLCSCNPDVAKNTCSTATYEIPGDSTVPCAKQTCNGTKACGGGWKEIAPIN